MKNKRFQNNKDCVMFVIILIIMICGVVGELEIFNLPDLFYVKLSNTNDLLNTLFTIQASIASLSIAIISIISAVFNNSVYGISISDFAINNRSKYFKPITIIIINSILIIFNYMFLSKNMFDLCVAVLFLTISLTLYMIWEISFLFQGKEKAREVIEQYILKNYDEKLLEQIKNDYIEAAATNNYIKISNDINLIKDIFEIECSKIYLSNKSYSEISEKLSKIVSLGFTRISCNNDPNQINEQMKHIIDIYKIANKEALCVEKPKAVTLSIFENISYYYHESTKILLCKNFEIDRCYIKMFDELYLNLIGASDISLRIGDIQKYAGYIYNDIVENSNMNFQEKKKVCKTLYARMFSFLFYNKLEKNENNLEIIKFLLTGFNILNKEMIKKGDFENINRYLITEDESVTKQDKETRSFFNISILAVIIYLYYLCCREECVNNTEVQKNAQNIVKKYRDNIGSFWSDCTDFRDLFVDIIENYYIYILRSLDKWDYEHAKEFGDIKLDRMEETIRDTIIFLSINLYYDNERLERIFNAMTNNHIERILMLVRPEADTEKREIQKRYEEYNKWIGNNDNCYDRVIDRFLQYYNNKTK